MKVEEMDEPLSIDPDSRSIPDINLMKMVSDEFNNFLPSSVSTPSSSDETRESGDGDSGGESKDNIDEFNRPNTSQEMANKSKTSRKASKIPIRKPHIPKSISSIIVHEVVKEDSENSVSVEDEDVEVPILEAPEEFRGFGQHAAAKPEERHNIESLQHDDHNTPKAETGDTSRRTAKKIPIEISGSGMLSPDGNTIAISHDEYGIRDQSAGDQLPKDNGIVTMGHVGSCTAPNDTVIITEATTITTTEVALSAMAQENKRNCCDVSSCASHQEQPTAATSGPSIGIGVAQCAQASGCSRVTTAKVCVALNPAQHSSCAAAQHCQQDETDEKPTVPLINDNTLECNNNNNNISNGAVNNLCWGFRNGRLVFDVVSESADSADDESAQEVQEVLYSKDLNKRIDEKRSRLKYLELKLKEAGITDDVEPNCNQKPLEAEAEEEEKEQVVDKLVTNVCEKVDYDTNQNIVGKDQSLIGLAGSDEEIVPEAGTRSNFCEFDVRQVGAFSSFNSCWEVYDELDDDEGDDDDDDEDGSDCDEYQHIVPIRAKCVQANTMGIDGERGKHNPDRDNLKSLLKRPGKTKEVKRSSNRVVFNENKNEFFDADYIILIREECDYDDEDDDSVCTCNQHEMVRLTCCEPNCNCGSGGGYDGYEQTPQSPKFAPPLEFVDAVTLSPPEGYKDMELEEQQLLALQQMARRGAAAAAAAAAVAQQRTAVCRECSVTHDDDEDEEASQSDNEADGETNSDHEEHEEKEKTDQSQQTTPTTPPNDADSPNSQRYILETMTASEQQRVDRDESRTRPNVVPPGGSPINGILKGGRLWKQQSIDVNTKPPEPQQQSDPAVASDDEGNSRRSVRFIESEQSKRDSCDGASDNTQEDDNDEGKVHDPSNTPPAKETGMSPESTEMMLTFKLGNHVLISNNSLKPNSAVRQLFPCTKPMNGKPLEDESIHQYLVTAESLRAFEEAKRSKLPQIIQSGETDESIKRAIERNTLRRSLIRYEPRSKKPAQKTDNSLVERIKQLTCDVDDANNEELRVSPPGEEARNSPEVHTCKNPAPDKSFSPSSSSSASSNSSSMSSTYKKITDLFGKRDKDAQNNLTEGAAARSSSSLPDLGNGGSHMHEIGDCMANKVNSNDSRKQFLSTLAPLTACVSGGVGGSADEYYHYQIGNHVGDRASMASSVGTEYSLEDIDEGLKNTANGGDDDSKKIAPDVLAGTPSASESGDELAMFVQQDASRIERIKKKYQPEQQQQHQPSSNKDEDDEHDDYGFNRRPSVRGIKPRFGSTTEILQQIQNQLQPPVPAAARVAWPYYSESGLTTGVDNKSRNINQQQAAMMANYQYPSTNVPDEVIKQNSRIAAAAAPPPPGVQYRPTSLQDENIYQNCTNQRCIRAEQIYRVAAAGNGNQVYSSASSMKISAADYYQSLPRARNGRPLSPPPLELSKNYHQTMVYIPYNHIEGYQATPATYYTSSDYVRVTNQNQINKRYIEPVYHQQRLHATHVDDHQYTSIMPPAMPLKPMVRIPLSRSESPVPGQFSTARATQTPSAAAAAQCNYYQANPRYRPMVGPAWPAEAAYAAKQNRHSFPRCYPPADNVSLTDSDSQHSSGQQMNGYRQPVDITAFTSTSKDSIPNSPTKPQTRYLERGVPEGAAANVPSQDSTTTSSSSTMTSPTSPQNPPPNNQKPMFYAMNV